MFTIAQCLDLALQHISLPLLLNLSVGGVLELGQLLLGFHLRLLQDLQLLRNLFVRWGSLLNLLGRRSERFFLNIHVDYRNVFKAFEIGDVSLESPIIFLFFLKLFQKTV